MPLTVDWNAIRPIEGARAAGFEELCAQLARAETPTGFQFERKGTPDAGVECYAVAEDGSEWGWQAKYIDTLGDSQWGQIDDSVRTALDKHPRLIRYFVCAPLDRPDGRIEGRRSAMQRWNDHVEKWLGWARDRGMTVDFFWWGSHELLDRLADPDHVGRLRFWFDVYGFDMGWFHARLEEAVRTAGPRYSPELHVELPIAADLEAFGRTDQFFDTIKTRAKSIRKAFQQVSRPDLKELDEHLPEVMGELSANVQAILTRLAQLSPQPTGDLPFQDIAGQIESNEAVITRLEELLSRLDAEYKDKAKDSKETRVHTGDSPFREIYYHLRGLAYDLRGTRKSALRAEEIAGKSLLLIKGNPGTGKTHLLCDVAQHRLKNGLATILLMGQQFVVPTNPWQQIFQQLDLRNISADEFVGALEAAAQASGYRALLLIDGINEGAGRQIWPTYLSAFLAQVERSPWISVVLSVRTSYEEAVIPEEVRARAAHTYHHGFGDHEYDAVRTFFTYYNLELPSTPLLTPEFRTPLFLKTLCSGLSATGHRRLPRGFHGVTATFDLYLEAINRRLAAALNFNPKHRLVRNALEAFAKALVKSGDRWLPLHIAEQEVNALLPGRDFEQSLYRGLITEGILVEETAWTSESAREDVVFIAYERFADHIIAKLLLDAHLVKEAPEGAFAEGGPFAFLWDGSQYVPAGLLEALCIQVPERSGRELTQLAPKLVDRWEIRNAFRQSLIWRSPEAVSEETHAQFKSLVRTRDDHYDTLDALLTIATIPAHPLNARFLDGVLRKRKMPDRDASWSAYLRHAWQSNGAVDRMVDWASSVSSEADVDSEALDLSALALSWMLSTSNRFLRDHATKALVNLLTGRLEAVMRLVKHFADVDDLYISERVYAVACGTAMRSCDRSSVGKLAQLVYELVFAAKAPPVHILLRDYARGVIERALYLGAEINVDAGLIRPPYRSTWPHIPTDDEIKPLMPDWSHASSDRDSSWAQHRIGSSVMDDDFARYVIGTNSSGVSNHWLSISLEEPTWRSAEEKLHEFISTLTEDAQLAWERFNEAESELHRASFLARFPTRLLVKLANDGGTTPLPEAEDEDEDEDEDEESNDSAMEEINSEIAKLETEKEATREALDKFLSPEQVSALNTLLEVKATEGRRPPGFDLKLIQKYILWRVFDLGWTNERFGEFDESSIRSYGREANKAERMGKKYQWIAYHEILAYIADHYQYREAYRDEGDRAYEGPWQDYTRDIDPTCTLKATRGGTPWDSHPIAWWAQPTLTDWGLDDRPEEWLQCQDNLPDLKLLLRCSNPADGSKWINADGHFHWSRRPPADRDRYDIERRDFWYTCRAYLLKLEDADRFLDWAKGVSFGGLWMPSPPKASGMFIGEHGWSPAAKYFAQPYFGDDGWKRPSDDCPAEIHVMSAEYNCESNGFDCSMDETVHLHLPASLVASGLKIKWSGRDAVFTDAQGQVVAFDPAADSDGPSSLLIREDLLTEFLRRERLTVVWTVVGEKSVAGPGLGSTRHHSLELSGAYQLKDGGLYGFVNYTQR